MRNLIGFLRASGRIGQLPLLTLLLKQNTAIDTSTAEKNTLTRAPERGSVANAIAVTTAAGNKPKRQTNALNINLI